MTLPDKVASGSIYEVFAQQARVGGLENLSFDPTKNTQKASIFEARLWVYIGNTSMAKRVVGTPVNLKINLQNLSSKNAPAFKTKPDTLLNVTVTMNQQGIITGS